MPTGLENNIHYVVRKKIDLSDAVGTGAPVVVFNLMITQEYVMSGAMIIVNSIVHKRQLTEASCT